MSDGWDSCDFRDYFNIWDVLFCFCFVLFFVFVFLFVVILLKILTDPEAASDSKEFQQIQEIINIHPSPWALLAPVPLQLQT